MMLEVRNEMPGKEPRKNQMEGLSFYQYVDWYFSRFTPMRDNSKMVQAVTIPYIPAVVVGL
jgi:hypothetical protein